MKPQIGHDRGRALTVGKISFLLIAIVATVVLFLRWQDRPPVIYAMELKDGEVAQAVNDAIADPRVVIFVNVDWSITAVLQRKTFEEFAAEWQRARPEMPVSFHCIDFTSTSEYSAIEALPGWTETLERLGHYPFHGYGEFVWIVDGRLVEIDRTFDAEPDDLIQRTDRLFRTN